MPGVHSVWAWARTYLLGVGQVQLLHQLDEFDACASQTSVVYDLLPHSAGGLTWKQSVRIQALTTP